MKKKRVAFLASGGGSNVEALLKAMRDPAYPAEGVLVLSNKEKAGALDKARAHSVPAAFLDPLKFASREAYDAELLMLVKHSAPDLVCLAGYMRILSPIFVDAFAGRILNIHPALLPKFGGEGMYGRHVHEAVLKSGDTESGATVHFVDQGVDTGKIVLQRKVPVHPGDSAESLAARVLEAEHAAYPEALRRVCESVV